MNLIIDQGNTYSKFAFFKEDLLLTLKRANNKDCASIRKIIQERPIEKAIIASVADATAIIEILKNEGINYISMHSASKLPISLSYDTPESLGLDRIAAAVGAHSKQKHQTCLVIDIGTAITYDICTAEGQYIGGSIAPGLDMRLQAMHTFTKRLPLVQRKWGKNTWAKSTQEALCNGAQEGVIAEILHYISLARDEFGEISVFLTGGDAIFFEKKIKIDIFVAPNLVLEGLLEILKIN